MEAATLSRPVKVDPTGLHNSPAFGEDFDLGFNHGQLLLSKKSSSTKRCTSPNAESVDRLGYISGQRTPLFDRVKLTMQGKDSVFVIYLGNFKVMRKCFGRE